MDISNKLEIARKFIETSKKNLCFIIADSLVSQCIAEDMKDAYLEAGFGPLATYNAHNLYFNIDHILYRGKLKAVNFEKGNIKSSDHYPIFARLVF